MRGSFIHFVFIPSVVAVAKGSPLLPASFFPFYFFNIWEYVRIIWLGDRRDVGLVSYHRDLGVWMFPAVRRKEFVLAI